MKRLYFLIILILACGFAFAETKEKVESDAGNFLNLQQDKNDEYHLFLDSNMFATHENRQTLNEYRRRFYEITGKLHVIKSQMTGEMRGRSANMDTLNSHRSRMESLVAEHDSLLKEYRDWVSSIKNDGKNDKKK